jgi:antitoxin component YwqK of YwqJK toxin-antitoxin module
MKIFFLFFFCSLTLYSYSQIINEQINAENLEIDSNEINNENDTQITENFDIDTITPINFPDCGIRTERFISTLFNISEAEINKLDDKFEGSYLYTNISDLRYENGNNLSLFDSKIEIEKDVYLNGLPFTGIAFTNNEFTLNGIKKKRGSYTEFLNGQGTGKRVVYSYDGLIKEIYDRNSNLRKSYDENGRLAYVTQDDAIIEYFENGKIESLSYYMKSINEDVLISHRELIEEYDRAGNILIKKEYHCKNSPLIKSSFDRNDTHSIGFYTYTEEWVKEVEPFLHKYYYKKRESKTNIVREEGIKYRYILEDGNIVEIKDSIWKIDNSSIEYSLDIALKKIKANIKDFETVNGNYILKKYNGKKFIEGKYINNNLHGTWKSYYENGAIKCVANYNEGYLSGNFEYYDLSGKIKFQGNYNDTIVREKTNALYLINRMIDRDIDIENGRFPDYGRDGVFIRIFNDEKYLETYKNDILDGPYSIWKNGVLIESGIKP